MIRILFVCLGNICRSPMAEAVFAHKLRQEGLAAKVEVDSAGTGDWHIGASPHVGTQNVLAQNGIDWDHEARQLRKSDFDDFELIVAMDDENVHAINRRGRGRAQVRKMLEFTPGIGPADVPDPYYSGNFGQTYELVDEATDGLIDWVKSEMTTR